MLVIIVLAVFARHIFGRVMTWAAVWSTQMWWGLYDFVDDRL